MWLGYLLLFPFIGLAILSWMGVRALVKPSDVEYDESRRLSEFLLNFLGTSGNPVPRMSILREYVGGSIFHY